MFKMLGKFILIGLLLSLLVTACTPPAAPPAPTEVPTVEPTATPVPPTATPEPTATATLEPTPTRDPKPSVSNLTVGDNAALTGAKGYGATFDYGVQAVYASVDFANLPEKSKLTWTLTRNDYTVLEVGDYLTTTSGSLARLIIDQPRLLLPGTYGLWVSAGKLAVSGQFVIDVAGAKPGTTLLTERFDNNDLKWDVFLHDEYSAQIEAGQLQLKEKQVNRYTYSLLPAVFEDFDASVAVQRTAGPRDGYYGMLFRYTYDKGYAFEVADNGYFNISAHATSGIKMVVDWTQSAAIKSGQVNTLRVVAIGNQFACYINDQQVAAFKDDQFSQGSLGFAAGDYKQAGMEAAFDNVLVTVPEAKAVVALPTPTKSPAAAAAASTPGAKATPAPKATTAAGSPTMRQAVTRARNSTEALGGALDRLYHGSGVEACGPLMSDYLIVIGSPEFDMTGQPGNAQSAYGPYRQAVNLIGDKVAPIARVCISGGGTVGKLDFDLARQAINEAGSLLTQALNLLGQ